MHEATALATEYTHQAIETAIPIGKGFGPLNHMHSLIIRSVSRYVFPALCNFNRRVQIMHPSDQLQAIHTLSFAYSFDPLPGSGKNT